MNNLNSKTGQNLASNISMSAKRYKELINSEDGKNIHWTSDINCELPIKIANVGFASEIKPETIPMRIKQIAFERGHAGC